MKMDNDFFDKVALLIEQARSSVGRTADLTMCATYYEIGRMIVEKEQDGKARAEYGKGLLKHLSTYLSKRVAKVFLKRTCETQKSFIRSTHHQ